MRKLTFTNSAGVSIEFFKTPYLIEKLDGIDTPATAIQEQKAPYQDGTTYIDTLLNNREIVIRGAIVAPKVLAPIANYRGTLQAAMNPKLGIGTITFQNDSVTRYASGYVSSCLLPNKDAREPYQRFQITIICPDPFWYGAPVTVTSTSFVVGTRPMPSNAVWQGIAYGDGVFCSVAGSPSAKAAISTDGGNTWAAKTLPNSRDWYAIAYGGGVFCAVAADSDKVAISTDGGNTWAEKTLPSSGYWYSVAYGNGVFCCVKYGSNSAAISTDGGNTWAAKTLPSIANWYSVAYGNGVFCTVTFGGNSAAISTDGGNTWAAKTLPSIANWYSVAYGNGVFCTIAEGPSTKAAISTDGGNTWAAKTLPSSSNWQAIAYGVGVLIAVSFNSSSAASSIDGGNTWSAITLSSSNAWNAIAYGGGAFVVAGLGFNSCFITGETINIPSELPTPATLTISGPNTAIAVTNNEETLSVSKALLTGERIIINTAFGQKAITYYPVSGTPSNAMQYLDVDSVFWQLQPGYNNVFFTSAASITYRVKYIGV